MCKHFFRDLGLECKFEENKTILKTDHKTMEFRSSEFKQINAAIYKALTANKKLEVINQPWLGYYTTKIWESSEFHLSVREFIVPGKTYQMW